MSIRVLTPAIAPESADVAHNASEALYPELWRGLTFGTHFNRHRGPLPVNLVNNESSDAVDGWTYATTKKGRGIDFNDETDTLAWSASPNFNQASQFSLWVSLKVTGDTGGATVPAYMSRRSAFTDGVWEFFERPASGYVSFIWKSEGNTEEAAFTASDELGVGHHTTSLTRTRAGLWSLWQDGEFIQSVQDNSALDTSDNIHKLSIGKLSTEIDDHAKFGVYNAAYIWRGHTLTVAEMRLLERDNFAPWRKREAVIGKAPAAVGGLGIPIAAYHYEHHLRG